MYLENNPKDVAQMKGYYMLQPEGKVKVFQYANFLDPVDFTTVGHLWGSSRW